ncbi:hypothetical protein AVEN_214243-1 [Araneus ventricosus]|uniref:Uncharacterized protein n=1 Tax=Araneus ventricosus TaxID=182803 RepID=A0A4Y2U659_ARAVE|nr:hypothetical protein AVEN_214243-1 [Araneus ventricosus]
MHGVSEKRVRAAINETTWIGTVVSDQRGKKNQVVKCKIGTVVSDQKGKKESGRKVQDDKNSLSETSHYENTVNTVFVPLWKTFQMRFSENHHLLSSPFVL